MSKALEEAPLRDKLLLAISEVHSGNGTEGERIVDAVLSVLAHLAEPSEDEVKAVARAICALEHDPDGPTRDIYIPDDPDAIYVWAGFRPHARAAIAAMRHTLSPEDRARVEEVRALHAKIGRGPLSEEWMYSTIRHCQRNMEFDFQDGGNEPDRYAGEPMAKIINALPELFSLIDKLTGKV